MEIVNVFYLIVILIALVYFGIKLMYKIFNVIDWKLEIERRLTELEKQGRT